MDRRESETALQDLLKFFLMVGDATACATKGKARTQNAGVADAFGEFDAAVDGGDELGLRCFETDLAHRVLEKEAIFGLLDGVDLGADEFDAILVEHSGFGEFHGEVQTRLAADRG